MNKIKIGDKKFLVRQSSPLAVHMQFPNEKITLVQSRFNDEINFSTWSGNYDNLAEIILYFGNSNLNEK